MRKRGNIRTFNKVMYRKSPIIPTPIAVKHLNNLGYSARTVNYANGDKSLFIKRSNKPNKPINNTSRIYNKSDRSPFDPIPNYTDGRVSDQKTRMLWTDPKTSMGNLRTQAYKTAKELRWLVIREKSSGNLLSIGLVPEPIARMHLDLHGFDVDELEALNVWKNAERSMTFGLVEPIGQQLIDLQRQNNSLTPSFSMDRINEEFEGNLEYIISPERAKFEESLSNERIEDIIDITGKTPNPFMGEENTEFFRLYSWFPESAMYLTLEESESIVRDAYARITDGVDVGPMNKDLRSEELYGFVGIKMLGSEGLKNDIGLGINLQSDLNYQFYEDMKNLQKDKWVAGETKPYNARAIASVADDYGISPEDYERLEWESPMVYKNVVLSQLEIMFNRGDEPLSWFDKRWESN